MNSICVTQQPGRDGRLEVLNSLSHSVPAPAQHREPRDGGAHLLKGVRYRATERWQQNLGQDQCMGSAKGNKGERALEAQRRQGEDACVHACILYVHVCSLLPHLC